MTSYRYMNGLVGYSPKTTAIKSSVTRKTIIVKLYRYNNTYNDTTMKLYLTQSHLTNWVQKMKVGQSVWSSLPVLKGAPQGSILSLLLFNLMIMICLKTMFSLLICWWCNYSQCWWQQAKCTNPYNWTVSEIKNLVQVKRVWLSA